MQEGYLTTILFISLVLVAIRPVSNYLTLKIQEFKLEQSNYPHTL